MSAQLCVKNKLTISIVLSVRASVQYKTVERKHARRSFHSVRLDAATHTIPRPSTPKQDVCFCPCASTYLSGLKRITTRGR